MAKFGRNANGVIWGKMATAFPLIPGLGPPGPLEKEAMTKKPLTDNEIAAATVPCCKNEENSPTNAGCLLYQILKKVAVM